MFIRTPRLFLRPAWREDMTALTQMLSDPGYQRDLAGSPWLEAMADADEFLIGARDPREARLLIFRRTNDTPRLVGAAGLGWLFNRTEFGLWLEKGERRRGFAQEAGRAVLSLAFDGLRVSRVWAPAFQESSAARLLSRLGFQRQHRDAPTAVLNSSDWSVKPSLAA